MTQVLYDRQHKPIDRTVRCMLTYRCNRNCHYCNVGVPQATAERKDTHIPPEDWAEGLNRRQRYTILAGGEPSCYPGFFELVSWLNANYKIEIYSNLMMDVYEFIQAANRPYVFLASFHENPENWGEWLDNANILRLAGHPVRGVHIVKHGDWRERVRFLQEHSNLKTTLCDDQRSYLRSRGRPHGVQTVTCTNWTYIYGPDGYRYMCSTKCMLGVDPQEHISQTETEDGLTDWTCPYFGDCVGCDNNPRGRTVANESSFLRAVDR